MNRWGWLTLAVCAAAFANMALANRAPPFDPPQPPAPPIALPAGAEGLPLVIRVDPNARVTRLILPPEAAGGDAGAPPGAVPAPSDSSMLDSTPRTIVAGFCLSLAAIGLFFVTRVQGSAKLLVIGLASATAIAGGAFAWADIPPGPPPRPNPAPQPNPLAVGQARVVVEWTGKRGAPVTLIIAANAIQIGPGVRVVPPPPPGAPAPPRSERSSSPPPSAPQP